MPYKFLEEKSIADVAFEATGKTLKELVESAANAVTETMIKDMSTIEQKIEKKISVNAENPEMLVYRFLQELVILKDSEQLLFSKFEIGVAPQKKGWRLDAVAYGDKIDPKKYDLQTDVKAVTMHNFEVKETENGWEAQVTLDI